MPKKGKSKLTSRPQKGAWKAETDEERSKRLEKMRESYYRRKALTQPPTSADKNQSPSVPENEGSLPPPDNDGSLNTESGASMLVQPSSEYSTPRQSSRARSIPAKFRAFRESEKLRAERKQRKIGSEDSVFHWCKTRWAQSPIQQSIVMEYPF